MIHHFTHKRETSIRYFCYTTACEQIKQKIPRVFGWINKFSGLGTSEKTAPKFSCFYFLLNIEGFFPLALFH